MPKFVVEMERDVTDTLRCAIEVEADGQNNAIKAARTIVDNEDGEWRFYMEVKRGRVTIRSLAKMGD